MFVDTGQVSLVKPGFNRVSESSCHPVSIVLGERKLDSLAPARPEKRRLGKRKLESHMVLWFASPTLINFDVFVTSSTSQRVPGPPVSNV